jgi:hypothetical protein
VTDASGTVGAWSPEAARAADVGRVAGGRVRLPWWHWPHLLSLDAPAVAVAWGSLIAAWGGVELSAETRLTLAGIVWAVYLLDRLADQKRGQTGTLRHGFAAAHRRTLGVLLLFAVTLAIAFVASVPTSLHAPGLALGCVIAAYLAIVHGACRSMGRVRGLKEAVAGTCFALGTSLPLWGAAVDVSADAVGIVALFSAACWWNCRLIDRWEGGLRFGRFETAALLVLALGSAGLAPPPSLFAFASLGAWFVFLHFVITDRARARALIDVGMAVVAAAWWTVP